MTADASRGERATITSGVDEIRHRHLAAIDALVPLPSRAAVTAEVEQQIDELRAMLTALSILREASPRSCDGIAAAGELLSSRVVAGAIQAAGIDAVWVDARKAIVTDDQYTAAAPLTAETGDALKREVAPHLAAGPRAGHRRLRRGHARRRRHDARARGVGLLGGDHRRGPGRRRDPDLDRRRRHAHRRPQGRARSARRRAPLVRRGVRARLLRREGPAPEHDPSGRIDRHPGTNPQQPPA